MGSATVCDAARGLLSVVQADFLHRVALPLEEQGGGLGVVDRVAAGVDASLREAARALAQLLVHRRQVEGHDLLVEQLPRRELRLAPHTEENCCQVANGVLACGVNQVKFLDRQAGLLRSLEVRDLRAQPIFRNALPVRVRTVPVELLRSVFFLLWVCQCDLAARRQRAPQIENVPGVLGEVLGDALQGFQLNFTNVGARDADGEEAVLTILGRVVVLRLGLLPPRWPWRAYP